MGSHAEKVGFWSKHSLTMTLIFIYFTSTTLISKYEMKLLSIANTIVDCCHLIHHRETLNFALIRV